MQDQLQIFTNSEFGEMKVLMIDGKPYFPASECASALGYSKPANAIVRHCKGALKRGILTNGGIQAINFIPEGDLYRLIVNSKLPSAQKFETWIFEEVLPSIRKFGAYLTDEAIDNVINHPDFAFKVLQAMIEERRKNDALKARLAAVSPKARYCDEILKSKTAIQASIVAKDYGMSAVRLNRLLHTLGIQYKVGDTWLLYQNYADKGYTKTVTFKITPEKTAVQTYWTQAGRMFIYELLHSQDILPLMESNQADANNKKSSQ
jgi:prophage antirepressor-like protein